MKALFLLFSSLAFATSGDPYLVETKVKADLESSLSRIIRKNQYLVQVNVEVSTHSSKKMFEAETTVGSNAEVTRRPAAEVTAGFVPEPEVKSTSPTKEERQVYRFVETPTLEAIRVQIQVDDKLPENVLNQARALAGAYINTNYSELGTVRVTEVTMLKPEWWEREIPTNQWLGWLASACLLMFLMIRRGNSKQFLTIPAAVSPAPEIAKPTPPPESSNEIKDFFSIQESEETRKMLLSQIVLRGDCFRGYYSRLAPEHRLEIYSFLKGPAFESVLERLGLGIPKAQAGVSEEVKRDRILWHEKNFEEFVEMSNWQDKQLFGFLTYLTDEQLAALAQHEDSKTVCLMLRFMKPGQAATILDNFPKEKQLEILSHVPALKSSAFSEIASIEAQVRSSIRHLPNHFFALGSEDSAFWGQVVGESKEQDKLVETLEKTQSDMLPQLKKLKFKLEDAAQLGVEISEKVFNDVDNELLSLAMVSCDGEAVKVFLNALPQKRRELVEQQITSSRGAAKETIVSARQVLTAKFRENLP